LPRPGFYFYDQVAVVFDSMQGRLVKAWGLIEKGIDYEEKSRLAQAELVVGPT